MREWRTTQSYLPWETSEAGVFEPVVPDPQPPPMGEHRVPWSLRAVSMVELREEGTTDTFGDGETLIVWSWERDVPDPPETPS